MVTLARNKWTWWTWCTWIDIPLHGSLHSRVSELFPFVHDVRKHRYRYTLHPTNASSRESSTSQLNSFQRHSYSRLRFTAHRLITNSLTLYLLSTFATSTSPFTLFKF